ncbi:hypothetical protein SAMN05216388_102659, partial [Halorientalis persicus]
SVFSYTWLDFRFRILFRFLRYSVSNAHDPPFITGFIRPIYSPKTDASRITLRLTRL